MGSSEKIILTATDSQSSDSSKNSPPWVVLVIDDEQGVLDVTYHVLKRFRFKGRNLQLENAKSLEEAIALYHKFPKAAVALIDCTMEKNTSGLDFINFVRHEQSNETIQLVLRTGQPGFAPETEVLTIYEINDYLSKTELTSAKLKHRMISYLRAYENLVTISKQNNTLRQLDKVKDNFLSFVSHELRSPLRASRGLINLLSEDYASNKELQSELLLIESCNQRMDLLIGDLIDSAMIRNDEFRMNFSMHDMNEVVSTIMPNLNMLGKYLNKDDAVDIINDIPKHLPQIEVDASRIQQVIINLVNNALKNTTTGSIKISAEKTQTGIAISITDTGCGMAEEDISNIFEMFTQGQKPITDNQEGLGLGLAIAKKIIDSHNGSLIGKNNETHGCTFSFFLPFRQQRPN
jgi:signal transduction histidine kinase